MNEQAELVNYLRQVIGEEGCCVTCSSDDVYYEDGTWKLKLENFLEPWELGPTVEDAKARIKEYASMGFGLDSASLIREETLFSHFTCRPSCRTLVNDFHTSHDALRFLHCPAGLFTR